jgi:hypothetical protein
LQTEALAAALAGGEFRVVADDGRLLVCCQFSKAYSVDSDDQFSFRPFAKKKAIAKGRAARFVCYAAQDSERPVLVGSIGPPALAKSVDMVLEDTMFFEGMTFELDEFTHIRGAKQQ